MKSATDGTESRPAGRCRRRGAGIEGVVMAIRQAVERHRGRSRRGHAEQDAQPVQGSPRQPSGLNAASAAPSRANGRAKSVWRNFTRSRNSRAIAVFTGSGLRVFAGQVLGCLHRGLFAAPARDHGIDDAKLVADPRRR